ncbi:MAG: hypothetical protein AAGC68_15775 [Verrucomicrobiota bacterium]
MKLLFLLSVLIAFSLFAGHPLFAREEKADAPRPLASLEDRERYRLLRFLNEATLPELLAVPGIGKSRAGILVAGRPFFEVTDLFLLDSFGEKTTAQLVTHLRKSKRDRVVPTAAR